MKLKNTKWIVYLFIVSIVLNIFTIIAAHNFTYEQEESINPSIISLSTQPAHIYISGNQGWIDLKAAGGCSGEGTESDPYVISGLKIDCQGIGSGILIENSDVFFIISDCTIYNSGWEINQDAGINLENVDNGQILDCEIYSVNQGIHGVFISNIRIIGNFIHEMYNEMHTNGGLIGIVIGEDLTISNNYLRNGKASYIQVSTGSNIVITNNQILHTYTQHVSAIIVGISDPSVNNDIEITDNTFQGTYEGIMVYADNCIISRNTAINIGRYVFKITGNYITFEENEANNLPLYGFEITGSYNTIINNIAQNNGIYGFSIIGSDCTISGNLASGNSHGFYISGNNNDILSNIANSNGGSGIYLSGSGLTITENNANSNSIGFEIACDNSMISDNTATLNGNNGIHLSDSSDYNTIQNNNLNDNGGYGLTILGTHNTAVENTANSLYGVRLGGSSNIVELNDIRNCNTGIVLTGSSHTVIYNDVYYNDKGLTSSGTGSTIYQNNFIGNSINAEETGTNFFDNGVLGNVWDDYTGVDSDHDGIGDTSYSKNGVLDNFPIMDVYFPPNLIGAEAIYDPPQSKLFVTAEIRGLMITNVYAHIKNSQGIFIDQISLYDDGAHNDGNSGDGIYGNEWDGSTSEIGDYRIDIQAIDFLLVEEYWINVRVFTIRIDTGSLIIDSYAILGFWSISESWCSGDGTSSDPYIITNIYIDAGGLDCGILIDGLVVYLEIENSIVINSGITSNDAGIKIYNANIISLRNNQIESNGNAGVMVLDSINGLIDSNTIQNNNGDGIYLYHSTGYFINSNYISNSLGTGIELDASTSNNIWSNQLRESLEDGINLHDSSNDNSLLWNIARDNNDDGINILSDKNYLGSNEAYGNSDNGFEISACRDIEVYSCIASSNYGSGFYLSEISYVDIEEWGHYDTILDGCTASWNNENGIWVINCDGVISYYGFHEIIIEACTTERNERNGVFVYSSNLFQGVNLLSRYNDENGIKVVDSNWVDVSYSTSDENEEHGFFLSDSPGGYWWNSARWNKMGAVYSKCNSIFENCTFSDSPVGVYLDNAYNDTFINCNFSGLQTAIGAIDSTECTIIDSNIDNSVYGIVMINSTEFSITDNTINDSTIYGLYLTQGSSENVISNNEFNDNNDGDVQAYDDSGENEWSQNYWSDYEDLYPDATIEDGEWNIPYEIDGDAGASDDGSQPLPTQDPIGELFNKIAENLDKLETLIENNLRRGRKIASKIVLYFIKKSYDDILERYLNEQPIPNYKWCLMNVKLWILSKFARNPEISEICSETKEWINNLKELI